MPPTFIFSAFLSTLSLRRATMDTASKNRYLRFLSTLSLRRATRGEFVKREINRHFYPRSPCGERPRQKISIRQPHISIHALLAESDVTIITTTLLLEDFYPRSPCGERHTYASRLLIRLLYFYPRSPCGERRDLILQSAAAIRFLSTLSLRRATSLSAGIFRLFCISIHALLAESDITAPTSSGKREISIHALLAESDRSYRVHYGAV